MATTIRRRLPRVALAATTIVSWFLVATNAGLGASRQSDGDSLLRQVDAVSISVVSSNDGPLETASIETQVLEALSRMGIRRLPAGEYPRLEVDVRRASTNVNVANAYDSLNVPVSAYLTTFRLMRLMMVPGSTSQVPGAIWERTGLVNGTRNTAAELAMSELARITREFELAWTIANASTSTHTPQAFIIYPGVLVYRSTPEAFVPPPLEPNAHQPVLQVTMPEKQLAGSLIGMRIVHFGDAVQFLRLADTAGLVPRYPHVDALMPRFETQLIECWYKLPEGSGLQTFIFYYRGRRPVLDQGPAYDPWTASALARLKGPVQNCPATESDAETIAGVRGEYRPAGGLDGRNFYE